MMGMKRRYWSAREVMALKQGVYTHGVGKWSAILSDPSTGPILSERTNVNLKDKWRSILVRRMHVCFASSSIVVVVLHSHRCGSFDILDKISLQ